MQANTISKRSNFFKTRFAIFFSLLSLTCFFGGALEAQTFDKTKDILIAQFDNKPDADDIQSQAALASILAHADGAGVNYYAVTGAYGMQTGAYISSRTLFAMAFGPENVNWTDAHLDRTNSVIRIKNKIKPILLAGGTAWVQEAGQSNITADWIAALLSDGVPAATVKSNVKVIQHSTWNEGQTTASDLTYVKTNATYIKIGDGNSVNTTPSYKSGTTATDLQYMKDAKAATNPNATARNYWTEADRIIDASGFTATYSPIDEGGLDFSDCVENWYILGLGDNAWTIRKFWDRYVVNTVNTPPVVTCWTKGYSAGWDLAKPVGYSAVGVVEAVKTAIQINTLDQPHNEWAAAKLIYADEAGVYDVILTSLQETDGESTYRVLVNGTNVLEFQNPRILGTTTADYTPYTVGVRGISVPKGAVIQVDFKSNSNGLVPEGTGFAWARARWRSLSIGTCNSVIVDKWIPVTTAGDKTLTITPSTNGTIAVTPEGAAQTANSTVTLTAKPAIGYKFNGWSGDVSGSNIVSTLKMDVDKTVSASFLKTNNFAINCGGDQYVAVDGTVYAQTPAGFTKANTITGTTDQLIYQSEMGANAPFSYDLPVDNGNYTVTLKFAEIWFTAAAKRVFNVAIEGMPMLTNYDIFVDAGGINKAIDKTFKTIVSDGVLNIGFTSVVNNAKISAINVSKDAETSVGEISLNNNITVYPNPATDKLFYNSTDKQVSKIELVDLTGKIVYSANVQLHNGSVDLKGIAKGMYLVKIHAENNIVTKKISVK